MYSHSAMAKALYIRVFFSVGQRRYFSLQICMMQVRKSAGALPNQIIFSDIVQVLVITAPPKM